MAGRLLKYQWSIVGFCEGFINMMWEQHYKETDKKHVFNAPRIEMVSRCNKVKDLLIKEGGKLSVKDVRQIKERIDKMKDTSLDKDEFNPMLAISFCIELLIEQLAKVHGEKGDLFANVLNQMIDFEKMFDKDQKYDCSDGFDMAEIFRQA